jgi:hypothetical protein
MTGDVTPTTDLLACPPCKSPTPICDRSGFTCVACLDDADCGPALLCRTRQCVPGCSAAKSQCAPDAGRCDVDAGVCRGCNADAECGKATPRCDLASGRCVECVPGVAGQCPGGTYCLDQRCVKGCGIRGDCGAGEDCCNHLCTRLDGDAKNCGACGFACKSACCKSACVDLAVDVNNCGACGTTCAVANGTPACKGSRCAVGACQPGWADCNGAAVDGCEVNVDVDTANCGQCGAACDFVPNGQAACKSGKCVLGACNPNYADCNGDLRDGCEAKIDSDVDNCGKCGSKCRFNNAFPLCKAGQCTIGNCVPPYADCDRIAMNGCEVNTSTDAKNCGACGNACNGMSCASGACGLIAWYTFDEGAGNVISDVTGNGNNGTHNAAYGMGRKGSALSFDGSSMGIIPQGKLKWGDKNADYTVEYWILVTAGANGKWRNVIHHGMVDLDRTSAHFIGPGDNTFYPMVSTVNNPSMYFVTAQLPVNVWTHIADVKQGNTWSHYRSGVLLNTTQISDTVGNSGPLYIGNDPWYSGLVGMLDEVRIYGRALSQKEILADMN